MEEELKEYGLKVLWNDSQDSQQIDFSIADGEDNVCWVWGDIRDVDWECNHPYECIDFGDKTEQGECMLCGSYCDFHFVEDDEGHKIPEPHEWYSRRDVGGIIERYLKELQAKNV